MREGETLNKLSSKCLPFWKELQLQSLLAQNNNTVITDQWGNLLNNLAGKRRREHLHRVGTEQSTLFHGILTFLSVVPHGRENIFHYKTCAPKKPAPTLQNNHECNQPKRRDVGFDPNFFSHFFLCSWGRDNFSQTLLPFAAPPMLQGISVGLLIRRSQLSGKAGCCRMKGVKQKPPPSLHYWKVLLFLEEKLRTPCIVH